MIDFPNAPTLGQVFTSGGQSWTWDGVKWVPSGSVVMPPLSTGENRIINGDMRIDQRNNGASVAGAASGIYTVDRWGYYATVAAKGSCQQVKSAAAQGFQYVLGFTSSSAYTLLAADQFLFTQTIEADMIGDFGWGTSSAQPVTLSFWALSSLTGTFGGSIHNGTGTRSYPFSYSLPVANTWAKISITIPGDATGAWTLQGNGSGLGLYFDLGTGSTYRAPAGAWTSNPFVTGATGAISVVAVNGATFYVTGVKLEIGSVATPFNRQSLAKSMADCQRYYQIGSVFLAGTGTANNTMGQTLNHLVQMRVQPTIAFPDTSYNNCSGLAANGIYTFGFSFITVVTTTGGYILNSSPYTASAEL